MTSTSMSILFWPPFQPQPQLSSNLLPLDCSWLWSPLSFCLSWKVCAYLLQCSIPVNNSIIIPETLQLWKNTGTSNTFCLSPCVFFICIHIHSLVVPMNLFVLLWDTVTLSWISVFNRYQMNAVDWLGWRRKNIPTYLKKLKIVLMGMVQNWVE